MIDIPLVVAVPLGALASVTVLVGSGYVWGIIERVRGESKDE